MKKYKFIKKTMYSLIYLLVFIKTTIILSQSIIDIQPNKIEQTRDKEITNKFKYELKLINLNSQINKWFLLEILNIQTQKKHILNIENIFTNKYQIKLPSTIPVGIELSDGTNFIICNLEESILKNYYQEFSKLSEPYILICEDKIYIKIPVKGRASAKELVTNFLRKYLVGGEQITTFVKDHFYKDKYILQTKESKSSNNDKEIKLSIQNFPLPAKINPEYQNTLVFPKNLGIKLENLNENNKMMVGQWYQVASKENIYVSTIKAKHVDNSILNSFTQNVNKLDDKELNSLTYLVAFDLDSYELEFINGTEHPDVGWSPRVLDKVKTKDNGPDGFNTKEPLITTGKVPPFDRKLTVATFTGGFKRDHAAFKWGHLSTINKGSHYGVIETGVIFSSLNPQLATLIITKDQNIIFKTWEEQDWKTLQNSIKHARQNGVPIIDGIDSTSQLPIPTKFVNKWGEGNWSGSTSSTQRALRAGICIQNKDKKQFLIYAYFSSATPNSMARVFQAYYCYYAMHLDMNALEHTYLALYHTSQNNIKIEHLIDEMKVLDVKYQEHTLARFLHIADNRDFFYLKRKTKGN